MTTDQNSTIDTTVIEALRPQSRRYDVAIDTELVLSVLPNGVKTWTWVYDDPSDPHRKTLGIYPDMSLEDAKKSLAAEKSSYRRADGQDPEFVIRDGRIQPATSSSSQLPIILGAIVAMIAVAVITYLLTGNEPDSDTAAAAFDDDSPFASQPTATAVQLPTISQTPPAAAMDNDNQTDVVAGNRDNDSIDPVVTPPETQLAAAAGVAATTPVTTITADTLPQTIGSAIVDRPTARPDQTQPAPMVDSRPADTTPQDDASLVPAANPTAAPVGTLITDNYSAAILDARVARGNLTTAVSAREPIDDLGSFIAGNGENEQTYYFFTELRGLAGQRVRHRWLYRGRVVAEIPFNVGDAWRWRVYSSKTFIASMTGPWHAQVVLDDDTVIYNLPFTFSP